ncbi:unnamed protein product [Paramecium octaurelia]|uniref:PHD-type domain-containing protein n=1 Tax=Paramecium octaurelia TaxID=43137 RepID=A0A8S1XC69_PAROT|nr:unnamed protein product [Paramecium octaurelia]
MNTKIETIPVLQEKCKFHQNEQANLICLTASCLNQGFFCYQCKNHHEGHNVIQGIEFFDTLKQLVCYDGSSKSSNNVNQVSARIVTAMLTAIDELEALNQYFSEILGSIRLQFEKYCQISNDVNVINNFLVFSQKEGIEPQQFKDKFEECLKRLCLKLQKLHIKSTVTCQSNSLFVPDERLFQEYLEPLISTLKGIRLQAESSFTKPLYYNKLDLTFKNGLMPQVNSFFEPIIFETDQPKEEDKVLERLWIDKNETMRKMLMMKQRTKEEQVIDDEPYSYGNGRLEKVFAVAGSKVWFLDFIYSKFKPTSKHSKIEPKQACIICKCHQKFARINEFLNCKYGDLYGPYHLEARLLDNFKMAFDKRTNKDHLIDRGGLYFHDLCVYWSSLVECDEKKGTIDFESLQEAVKISQETYCYLCKRKGPTLKCNNENCQIWIHYYCWKELEPSQQYLDTQKFRMLCYQHVPAKYRKPAWASQNLLLDDYQLEKKETKEFRQSQFVKFTYQEFGQSRYIQKLEQQATKQQFEE